MLNLFLASLVLGQWLLLEWLARRGPASVRLQANKLRLPWQAHTLFAAWALWLHGLALTERLWLHTLWPEAWMGLAILLTCWLLYQAFLRLWLRLYRAPEAGPQATFLAMLWLGGWLISYTSFTRPETGLMLLGLLAGVYCGRGRIRATLQQLALWLPATWAGGFFLRHPEAAMRMADTLPAHYNSLMAAGLVLPWLLLPLWLVLPWLFRGPGKENPQPLLGCHPKTAGVHD